MLEIKIDKYRDSINNGYWIKDICEEHIKNWKECYNEEQQIYNFEIKNRIYYISLAKDNIRIYMSARPTVFYVVNDTTYFIEQLTIFIDKINKILNKE